MSAKAQFRDTCRTGPQTSTRAHLEASRPIRLSHQSQFHSIHPQHIAVTSPYTPRTLYTTSGTLDSLSPKPLERVAERHWSESPSCDPENVSRDCLLNHRRSSPGPAARLSINPTPNQTLAMTITFFPPLFEQRQMWVLDVLRRENAKAVRNFWFLPGAFVTAIIICNCDSPNFLPICYTKYGLYIRY